MDMTEALTTDTAETLDAGTVERLGERMSMLVAHRTDPSRLRDELVADVRRGLGAPRKWLPPRWFYDDHGCELFEEITRLPEYYQTRTEAAILEAAAERIAELTAPSTMVELGAGSCTKTRILLDAMARRGLQRFVPVDVSEVALADAARRLTAEFPSLHVHGVVADFTEALDRLPREDHQVIVFLGSTIGNLLPHERALLLAHVRSRLTRNGAFLLGIDLVKPVADLYAAYNDAAGITAAFNRNLLAVVNRELGADFDTDAFSHEAPYDDILNRIEMHLRSVRDQWVEIPAADLRVHFAEGETVLTEISTKFTRARVEAELSSAGMTCVDWFSDGDERFALALAMPR